MSDKDLEKLFPTDVANKIEKASQAIKTFNSLINESSKAKGPIGQATKEY
jgi:hypothetical protein